MAILRRKQQKESQEEQTGQSDFESRGPKVRPQRPPEDMPPMSRRVTVGTDGKTHVYYSDEDNIITGGEFEPANPESKEKRREMIHEIDEKYKDPGLYEGEDISGGPVPWIDDPAAQQAAQNAMLNTGLNVYTDDKGVTWYTLQNGQIVNDKQNLSAEQKAEIKSIQDKNKGPEEPVPEKSKLETAGKIVATLAETATRAYVPKHVQDHIDAFRHGISSLLHGDLLGIAEGAVNAALNGMRVLGDGAGSFKSTVKQMYGVDPDQALKEGVKTARAKLAYKENRAMEKAVGEVLSDMATKGIDIYGVKEGLKQNGFHYDKSLFADAGMEPEVLDKLDKVLNASGINSEKQWVEAYTPEEKDSIARMLLYGDYGDDPVLMGRFISDMSADPGYLHDPARDKHNVFYEAQLNNTTYDFDRAIAQLGIRSGKPRTEIERTAQYYTHLQTERDKLLDKIREGQRGWKYLYDEKTGEVKVDDKGEPYTEKVPRLSSSEIRVLQLKAQMYDQAMGGMREQAIQNPILQEMYGESDQAGGAFAAAKAMSERKRRAILGRLYDSTPSGGAYQILAQGKYNEVSVDEDGTPVYDEYSGGMTALERVETSMDRYRASMMAAGKSLADLQQDQAWITMYNAVARMSAKRDYDALTTYALNSGMTGADVVVGELNEWYDKVCADYDWLGNNGPLTYKEYQSIATPEFYQKLGLKVTPTSQSPQVSTLLPTAGFSGQVTENPLTGGPSFERTNAKPGQCMLIEGRGLNEMPGSLMHRYRELDGKYNAGIRLEPGELIEYNRLRGMRAYQIREAAIKNMCAAVDRALVGTGVGTARRNAIKSLLRSKCGGRQSWPWKEGEVTENYKGPTDGVAGLENLGWDPKWNMDKEEDRRHMIDLLDRLHCLDKHQFIPPEEDTSVKGIKYRFSKFRANRLKFNPRVSWNIEGRLKDMEADENLKETATAIRKAIADGDVDQARLQYTLDHGWIKSIRGDTRFDGMTWTEVMSHLAKEGEVLDKMGYFGGAPNQRSMWTKQLGGMIYDEVFAELYEHPDEDTLRDCVKEYALRCGGEDPEEVWDRSLSIIKANLEEIGDFTTENFVRTTTDVIGNDLYTTLMEIVPVKPSGSGRQKKSGAKGPSGDEEKKEKKDRPYGNVAGMTDDDWELVETYIGSNSRKLIADPITGLPVIYKSSDKSDFTPGKQQELFIDKLDKLILTWAKDDDVKPESITKLLILRNLCRECTDRARSSGIGYNGVVDSKDPAYVVNREHALTTLKPELERIFSNMASDCLKAIENGAPKKDVFEAALVSKEYEPEVLKAYADCGITTKEDRQRLAAKTTFGEFRDRLSSATPADLSELSPAAMEYFAKAFDSVVSVDTSDPENITITYLDDAGQEQKANLADWYIQVFGLKKPRWERKDAAENQDELGPNTDLLRNIAEVENWIKTSGMQSVLGDIIRRDLVGFQLDRFGMGLDDADPDKVEKDVMKFVKPTPKAEINTLEDCLRYHKLSNADIEELVKKPIDEGLFKRLMPILKYGRAGDLKDLSKGLRNLLENSLDKSVDAAHRDLLLNYYEGALTAGAQTLDILSKGKEVLDKLDMEGKDNEVYRRNSFREDLDNALHTRNDEMTGLGGAWDDILDPGKKSKIRDQILKNLAKKLVNTDWEKKTFKTDETLRSDLIDKLFNENGTDIWGDIVAGIDHPDLPNLYDPVQDEDYESLIPGDDRLKGMTSGDRTNAINDIVNGRFSREDPEFKRSVIDRLLQAYEPKDKAAAIRGKVRGARGVGGRKRKEEEKEEEAGELHDWPGFEGNEDLLDMVYEHQYGNHKIDNNDQFTTSLRNYSKLLASGSKQDSRSKGTKKKWAGYRETLNSLKDNGVRDQKDAEKKFETLEDLDKFIGEIGDNWLKTYTKEHGELTPEGQEKALRDIRRVIMEPIASSYLDEFETPGASHNWLNMDSAQLTRLMSIIGIDEDTQKKIQGYKKDFDDVKYMPDEVDVNGVGGGEYYDVFDMFPGYGKEGDNKRIWSKKAKDEIFKLMVGGDKPVPFKDFIESLIGIRLSGMKLKEGTKEYKSKADALWKEYEDILEGKQYGTKTVKLKDGEYTKDISPSFWAEINKICNDLADNVVEGKDGFYEYTMASNPYNPEELVEYDKKLLSDMLGIPPGMTLFNLAEKLDLGLQPDEIRRIMKKGPKDLTEDERVSKRQVYKLVGSLLLASRLADKTSRDLNNILQKSVTKSVTKSVRKTLRPKKQ